MISFKKFDEKVWKTGEVKDIKSKNGTKEITCVILLESDDIMEVDISSGMYEWKYVQFPCELCKYQFHTRNGLFKHKRRNTTSTVLELMKYPLQQTKTVSIDNIVFAIVKLYQQYQKLKRNKLERRK